MFITFCFFHRVFLLARSRLFPLSEGHEPRKRNHDHRQSQIIIGKEEKCMLELSEIKTLY